MSSLDMYIQKTCVRGWVTFKNTNLHIEAVPTREIVAIRILINAKITFYILTCPFRKKTNWAHYRLVSKTRHEKSPSYACWSPAFKAWRSGMCWSKVQGPPLRTSTWWKKLKNIPVGINLFDTNSFYKSP